MVERYKAPVERYHSKKAVHLGQRFVKGKDSKRQHADGRAKNGRKKGSINTIPKFVKEAVLMAMNEEGSDEQGADGLIGWIRQAIRGEAGRAMGMAFLTKVTPVEMTGAGGGPVRVTVSPDMVRAMPTGELETVRNFLDRIKNKTALTIEHQPGDAAEYAKEIGVAHLG